MVRVSDTTIILGISEKLIDFFSLNRLLRLHVNPQLDALLSEPFGFNRFIVGSIGFHAIRVVL